MTGLELANAPSADPVWSSLTFGQPFSVTQVLVMYEVPTPFKGFGANVAGERMLLTVAKFVFFQQMLSFEDLVTNFALPLMRETGVI